jgi:predicted permease
MWTHDWLRDVRYALRGLLRDIVFTATAVLSLALGIGANTAIFSILHSLVLRSLPVSDPEELVVISRGQLSAPYPLFRHFQDRSQTLAGVVAFRTTSWRLRVGRETEQVTGVLASGSYFDVLGVPAAAGTTFTPEDDVTPGSGGARGPVAVLGHGLWMRSFAGSTAVIGSRILLNEQPFTVVGIAPEGFTGTEVGDAPDVYAPMSMQPVLLPELGKALLEPRSNWIRMIARLKAGVDVRQAEAELTTLLGPYNQDILRSPDAGRFGAAWRRNLLNQRITLLPGHAGISSLREQYSKPLWVLMTTTGLVLLISCANVASLLVTRAVARRREIAIRLALGAARRRLITQLLIESLMLACAGGVGGLLLARWLRDVLLTYLPPSRSLAAPLDSGLLLFTAAICTGAAVLFGLVPALQATKVDVTPALKGGPAAPLTGGTGFGKALVVFQMALSCVLLIAATLFLRSLHNLLTVDTGFTRQNILIASINTGIRGSGFYLPLIEAARGLPGVLAAAVADSPPLGVHTGWDIHVPGFAPGPNESRDSPSVGFVSPGYFSTMNIPVLNGRDFADRDLGSNVGVMIVNETFAKHFFGAENPVGRRVGLSAGVYDIEIIGVVKDGKYTGLREEPTRMVFVPYRAGPWASRMVLHLRTASDPAAVASALRLKVREIDPNAPLFDIRTVQTELDRSLLRERLVGRITALFGGLALLLAAIGLYGTMSHRVARRTREFGIRVAVGAGTGSILRLVLGEAAWLLACGLALGFAAAWISGRLVSSLLFGIEATDLVSAAIAGAVLTAAALAASWIPARRASMVDPTEALRAQ